MPVSCPLFVGRLIWFIILQDSNFPFASEYLTLENREDSCLHCANPSVRRRAVLACITLYLLALSANHPEHILILNIFLSFLQLFPFTIPSLFVTLPLIMHVKFRPVECSLGQASHRPSHISPAEGSSGSAHYKPFSLYWNIYRSRVHQRIKFRKKDDVEEKWCKEFRYHWDEK